MYNNYNLFLQNIINSNYEFFKSNYNYNSILEHVSLEYGNKYLNLIENEFPNINYSIILDFCKINDLYGNPKKEKFKDLSNNILICSPTSLRYIYHSLIILKYYSQTKCKNIVEVGCGYGGLCLAINYFMKYFDIEINNYHIIDLSEPLNLIKFYLNKHKSYIKININYHDSLTYGINIPNSKDLFFISNYCYTEIEKKHNNKYTEILLPKIINGFIIWQNGGNNGAYPISNCSNILNKEVKKIMEEKPQTDAGYDIYMNYFVYL